MRRELSTIKRKLGDYFAIDRNTIAANRDLIALDTVKFERAVSARDDGQQTTDHGRNDQQLATSNQQLTTYHGDFLAGFFVRDAPEFDQWTVRERERLRLLAINGFVRQLRQLQAAGKWQQALQIADKLTAIEPLLEEAQQAKLLLLARTGQRTLALKHYRQLVDLFEEELGVEVSAETTQIYNRIQRSSTPPAHNLHTTTTQFVGRQAETDTLQQLLAAPEQRLITLLGMGGMGKSSLARHVGRELVSNTPGSFLGRHLLC